MHDASYLTKKLLITQPHNEIKNRAPNQTMNFKYNITSPRPKPNPTFISPDPDFSDGTAAFLEESSESSETAGDLDFGLGATGEILCFPNISSGNNTMSTT